MEHRTLDITSRRGSRVGEREATALSAAALALVAAVCTLRYHRIHTTGAEHVLVVALGGAVVLTAVTVAVLVRRRVVAPWLPLGLGGATVVLVAVAPSAAWCVVPLIVVLHTALPVRPATITSGIAVTAAAVSVPRLTGARDPGLFLGCLLAGLVVIAAIVVSRTALAAQSRTVRELIAARARLVASERRASALEERRHVSAELHDTVVQSVAGALYLAEAAERSGDATIATGARAALRTAVADARALVDRLDADGSDDEPLEDQLAAVAARTGASLRVIGAPVGVSPMRALALVRTAQGALGNAERHAMATTVSVELHHGEHDVTVTVRDDGRGFDVGAAVVAGPDGGHGLTIMRRRVDAVGGTLDIRSDEGGTVVSVSVPVGHR